jgi:hypothetical protein
MNDLHEAPKNDRKGWTAERAIAVAILGRLAVDAILGRLAVDGLLADHVFTDELNYAVGAIAEVITASLAAMPGGGDGDLDKVLDNAQAGEQAEKGGAA